MIWDLSCIELRPMPGPSPWPASHSKSSITVSISVTLCSKAATDFRPECFTECFTERERDPCGRKAKKKKPTALRSTRSPVAQFGWVSTCLSWTEETNTSGTQGFLLDDFECESLLPALSSGALGDFVEQEARKRGSPQAFYRGRGAGITGVDFWRKVNETKAHAFLD